jgi:hypothetical protein
VSAKKFSFIYLFIHRMFLNVAAFNVTNRSISSTKTKIDFFKHFYLICYCLLNNVLLSCSANFGAPSVSRTKTL